MVQIIPNDDNVFGRLGREFGQSLAEQVPKALERRMLSAGLQNFEKESANLTPLQQAVKLYQIPGFTPEMGYTLTPLLQKQRGREALSQYGKEGGAPRLSRKIVEEADGQIEEKPDIGLKSLETTQAEKTPIRPPSSQELALRASELANLYPDASDDELVNKALQEWQRTSDYQRSLIESGQRQEQLQSRIAGAISEKEFAPRLPQTIKTRITNDVFKKLNDPKNKKSEAALVQEAKDKALDIDKAIGKLDRLTGSSYATGQQMAITDKSIGALRKKFEDMDSLEEFRDLIVSKFNFPMTTASAIAYPLRDDLRKSLKGIEKAKEPSDKIMPWKDTEKLKKDEQKVFEKIIPQIKPTDSLLTIAQGLRVKGYDPAEFLDRVKTEVDKGNLVLNDRQELEVTEPIDYTPTLKELLFYGMRGKDPFKELP